MTFSDEFGKKLSLLHQELVSTYRKRLMSENRNVGVVKLALLLPLSSYYFKVSFCIEGGGCTVCAKREAMQRQPCEQT